MQGILEEKAELIEKIKIAKAKRDKDEVGRLQRRMLELEPDNVETIYYLMTAAKREENWRELKRLQRKWKEVRKLQRKRLELDPNDVRAISDLVFIAKKNRNWYEVKKLQTRMLELEPDNERAKKDLEKATKEIAIKKTGKDEWVRKTKIAKKEGNWEEVKRLQIRILEMKPDDVKAIHNLVVVAKKQGAWDEVKRLQIRMLKINPDNVRAIVDLVIIAKREENWDEVRRLQTRMLEIKPYDVRAINDLVEIAKKQGNWEEVEKLQTRLAEIEKGTSRVVVQEEEFNVERQLSDKNRRISEIRARLYKGEIDISQIGEIAEEFKGNAKGTILIAEVCIYLGQQKLALQALKGYKQTNEQISPEEEKAIKRAIEIAKSKQKIADSNKWSMAYDGQEK